MVSVLCMSACAAQTDPTVVHFLDGGNKAIVDAAVDASCSSMQTFTLTQVPPNVMLVLDRSFSMINSGGPGSVSKWHDLKTSVDSLVTSYNAKMNLGVTLFPSDDMCGAGKVVAPASNNGAAVQMLINASAPGGNTPTGPTLTRVIKAGVLADATRNNVVVLATDGMPNCGEVDPATGKYSIDVTGKIQALVAASPSVQTYVIGIGDDAASNPKLLNEWADAGHTARSGNTKYYQTSSPMDLQNAFDTIVGGVVSCTFKLDQAPSDPSQLYVWLNGQSVPVDGTNGYTYDSASTSLTLHGTACDSSRMGSVKLSVIFGCGAPPVN
jgi:hypothetical protein